MTIAAAAEQDRTAQHEEREYPGGRRDRATRRPMTCPTSSRCKAAIPPPHRVVSGGARHDEARVDAAPHRDRDQRAKKSKSGKVSRAHHEEARPVSALDRHVQAFGSPRAAYRPEYRRRSPTVTSEVMRGSSPSTGAWRPDPAG